MFTIYFHDLMLKDAYRKNMIGDGKFVNWIK